MQKKTRERQKTFRVKERLGEGLKTKEASKSGYPARGKGGKRQGGRGVHGDHKAVRGGKTKYTSGEERRKEGNLEVCVFQWWKKAWEEDLSQR